MKRLRFQNSAEFEIKIAGLMANSDSKGYKLNNNQAALMLAIERLNPELAEQVGKDWGTYYHVYQSMIALENIPQKIRRWIRYNIFKRGYPPVTITLANPPLRKKGNV